MTEHKAAPEHWAKVTEWGVELGSVRDDCILELRARVEALEANAKSTSNSDQK